MSDLHESAHGVSKHVTLGFVLGWIFAAAFAILALVALFQPGQFMTGVFLILAALVALPPAHTFIKKKANVSISGVFRTALAIIFYFLSIAMLASVKDAASKDAPGAHASTASAPPQEEQRPSIGDIAYLRIPWAPSKAVLAADTTDDFNEMSKLIGANDSVGVAKMVIDGQVYTLDPNTEVRVIDSSFQTYQLVYQVRIMSGANFGDAAWVQGDFVSATSTTATTTADE